MHTIWMSEVYGSLLQEYALESHYTWTCPNVSILWPPIWNCGVFPKPLNVRSWKTYISPFSPKDPKWKINSLQKYNSRMPANTTTWHWAEGEISPNTAGLTSATTSFMHILAKLWTRDHTRLHQLEWKFNSSAFFCSLILW